MALAMKDLCPLSLQYELLASEQTMRQFSQGMSNRKGFDAISKQLSLRMGSSVWILLFTTKWFCKSMINMVSLELKVTISSFLSASTMKVVISSLKAMRLMLSSGYSMVVYQSQPKRRRFPYLTILYMSQLRQKFQSFRDQYLCRNLFYLPSLSYFCMKILFPTCQTIPSEGYTEKLRMGAPKQGLQCSSLPKNAEDALENRLSPFNALLYLYFTLQSLSLYSTRTSCPVRYPIINSACWMTTEVPVVGFTVRETMWRVAISFLERMLLRGMVEVMSLVMSDLKGYKESTSAMLSAATIKWRSLVEQVAVTIWKGQPTTLSFLISVLGINLFYSLSIIIHIMDHNSDGLVGLTMHMSIKWQWNISFVFQTWTVLEGQTGLIILGLALTIIVSILSVALPAMRNKVTSRLFRKKYNNSTLLIKERDTVLSENEDENDRPQSCGQHIFGFFYILIYSLFHIATMMLIMTYNGYVVIAVIAGLTLGYAIFGMECDKDKNIPVNCCA